jgi:hypothetical protein
METRALIEQLVTVRLQLDSAATRLTQPSPEAVESCAGVLEEAGRQVQEWLPSLADRAGEPSAAEEARRLRRSFHRLERLLEGAATLHLGWLQIRCAMTGGYTRTGEAAPMLTTHRISFEA